MNKINLYYFLNSKKINSLSSSAERTLIRMLFVVDACGRHESDPHIISQLLYQSSDASLIEVVNSDIIELTSKGLLNLYSVAETEYLEVVVFKEITKGTLPRCPGPESSLTKVRNTGHTHYIPDKVNTGTNSEITQKDKDSTTEILPKNSSTAIENSKESNKQELIIIKNNYPEVIPLLPKEDGDAIVCDEYISRYAPNYSDVRNFGIELGVPPDDAHRWLRNKISTKWNETTLMELKNWKFIFKKEFESRLGVPKKELHQ